MIGFEHVFVYIECTLRTVHMVMTRIRLKILHVAFFFETKSFWLSEFAFIRKACNRILCNNQLPITNIHTWHSYRFNYLYIRVLILLLLILILILLLLTMAIVCNSGNICFLLVLITSLGNWPPSGVLPLLLSC